MPPPSLPTFGDLSTSSSGLLGSGQVYCVVISISFPNEADYLPRLIVLLVHLYEMPSSIATNFLLGCSFP